MNEGQSTSNDGGKSMSDSITILVLGDEGVGKSSLIATFVSRHFSEVVPGLMTRVRLPTEPDSNCVTTIVDSQSGDAALIRAHQMGSETSLTALLQQHKNLEKQSSSAALDHHQVDAIILVYDLDRVETFYRMENHWLPLIERCYQGEIPVIVAGNKLDLIRPTPTGGAAEEQAHVRSRQQLVSLLQRFRFVRQCIKCSAKNVLRVHDVFSKAQQAVLYPFVPLFDLSTGSLTIDCKKAFTRIFRIFDQDNDGLLSDQEIDSFQYQTFRVPLVERDLVGWKKVVARNTDEQVVRDGKFTVAGFLAIFDVFISQNRLDVPWKVLRKFGYADDLTLRIPTEKRTLTKLTSSARSFLIAMFHQFDSNKDGVLSGQDLKELFSILPEPALPPWHPRRSRKILEESCFSVPAATTSSMRYSLEPGSPRSESDNGSLSVSAGGITICSDVSVPTVSSPPLAAQLDPMSLLEWMGHWQMMCAISPSVTRAELFRLGHGAIDRSYRKRRRTTSSSSSSSHMPPSEEIRIFLFSKSGCGKSSLLNLLCGKDVKDTVRTQRPETCTTHLECKRKMTIATAEKEEEEFVFHFIFTEVPENTSRQKLGEILFGQPKTRKLVVFLFDDLLSLNYAIDLENDLLQDDVPRVFVAGKGTHEERAVEHCNELDLEPPLAVNAFAENAAESRRDILQHLALCVVDDNVGFTTLKSKPHAEQKKKEAARRRKMIWLGGLVSVSVAVAVSVGFFWGQGESRRKTGVSRFGWFTQFFFGGSRTSSAPTSLGMAAAAK